MPDVRIVAVEPAASPVLSGGEPGFHTIQGWGAGFVPEILNTKVYDEVIAVSDAARGRVRAAWRKEEGILGGISCGGACVAALEVAQAARPRQDRRDRLPRHRRALPHDRSLHAEGI